MRQLPSLVQVSFVCVTNLLNSSYHARVLLAPRHIASHPPSVHTVSIDARPSDAINLALRFRSPIYVKKVGAAHPPGLRSIESHCIVIRLTSLLSADGCQTPTMGTSALSSCYVEEGKVWQGLRVGCHGSGSGVFLLRGGEWSRAWLSDW